MDQPARQFLRKHFGRAWLARSARSVAVARGRACTDRSVGRGSSRASSAPEMAQRRCRQCSEARRDPARAAKRPGCHRVRCQSCLRSPDRRPPDGAPFRPNFTASLRSAPRRKHEPLARPVANQPSRRLRSRLARSGTPYRHPSHRSLRPFGRCFGKLRRDRLGRRSSPSS